MNRLSRWSRRKLDNENTGSETEFASQVEPMAPSHDRADIEPASQEDTALAAPEPGSLDDALPDPDTLAPGSDIKAFMSPGVSAGLRKRALRRLFAAERYGIRDGLDDYDDDYQQRLKPLASEVAQRLRKWADRIDDTTNETTETDPETTADSEDNEQVAATISSDDGSSPDGTLDTTIAATTHESESQSTPKY